MEMVTDAKKRIADILKSYTGSKEDIAYMVYQEIASVQDGAAEVLRFFLDDLEDTESSEEISVERVFYEEEKRKYTKEYGKIIDGMLEVLLQKGYSEEKFYAELWEFISRNPILDNEKIKAFALYYIWIDLRVPYYELELGMKMSNDDYRESCKNLSEKIKKAQFILNVPTEQKTQRASRLIHLLDEVEDEREKVVLMAQIINFNSRLGLLTTLLKDKLRKDDEE